VVRRDGAAVDERRIETEVRTPARLHHPGLAIVFDAGLAEQSDSALPYLAMDPCPGRPSRND